MNYRIKYSKKRIASIIYLSFTLVIMGCVMIITKPISFAERSPIVPLILISIFYIVYLIYVAQSKKNQYLGAFALGFTFRLVLLFWDIYFSDYFMLPNSGEDSVGYYTTGIKYASGVINDVSNFWLVSGILVKIFGASRLFNQFIILLFSILAIHVTASILEMLGIQKKIRKYVIWLLCLLPNFAVLSSTYLRESLIILLLTFSLYFFLCWTKMGGLFNLCLSFIFVLAGAYFHAGVISVACGYAVIVAFYKHSTNTIVVSFKTGFIIIFFFILFAFLFINYGETLFAKFLGVESISDIGSTYDEGGASYARYVGDSRNFFHLVLYTPIRLVFFLLSPMPMFWRGINDVIAFAGSSLFYLLVWCKMLKTIVKYPKTRKGYAMMFVLILFCTSFVFAWGVTNSGTALRHRDKFVTFYIVALAICSDKQFIKQVEMK